jgi:hypothetical protein
MKLSLLAPALFLPLFTLASSAFADDAAAISVVDAKFADHVEAGKPAGDAKSIATAHKAIYWVDAANAGEAAQLTLVWKIDDKEVQRQSLDVGRSPHWHTWGSRPLPAGAKTVSVQVLDAAGKSLKEDAITLE